MMSNRFFLIGLIFIVLSCDKSNNNSGYTEVTVTCTNLLTGGPFNDVEIAVAEVSRVMIGLTWGESWETLEKGTPEEGLWHFAFDAKERNKYEYYYQTSLDPSRFYAVNSITFSVIEKGKATYIDLLIAPLGELKLDIKNVSCFDANDKLAYKIDYPLYPEFSSGWSPDRMGCYETVIPHISEPAGEHIITWQVTKSGIMTEFVDTIQIIENEDHVFNLHY